MAIRTANARWNGDLESGDGIVSVESGALVERAYTRASRFERGEGTNPDELLGAALASCYSMFLSALLSEDGHPPRSVRTEARVHLSTKGGPHVSHVELETVADVPGLDAEAFRDYAERSKECPIGRALASTEIRLDASLSSA